MKQQDAEKICAAGGFLGAKVVFDSGSWLLRLQQQNGAWVTLVETKKPTNTRAYKTVQAAVTAAARIGFDGVFVEGLDKLQQ